MREFASLITDGQVSKVVCGIENAVHTSFREDVSRSTILLLGTQSPSRAEVKRRTDICVKIFRVLRGDLKWGIERILDTLPLYLRNELDGISWEPEAKRASWVAA